jgi:hypothetical protein
LTPDQELTLNDLTTDIRFAIVITQLVRE